MKRRNRTIERLESRQLMASDWQNLSLIRDVDHSGLVTPLDALGEKGVRVRRRKPEKGSE